MNGINNNQRSSHFACKKWTLFTLSVVSMITTVIAVVFYCIALTAVDTLSSEMSKSISSSSSSGSSSWDQSPVSGSSNSPSVSGFGSDSTPNPHSWSWTETSSEVHVNASILIYSTGAIGAYKEHYCLSMTYAILLTISTVSNLGLLIHMPMIVASKI
ncbi:unnamed protein product [Oppiella nova]|uniref:Uncharacterized protein n=1 Tax=Oppiella nova TaxID=334625 RepID=A0A7R9M9H5_9ACAR|nr:unnamed protein product [Oppiella nova]CAG2173300.1 unnamed protein product [Oppiella nova]